MNHPLWLDGTASLSLLGSAGDPGGAVRTQPSLSGAGPAAFQVALTPEAATLQWEVLHTGKPALQAAYRMHAMARLPAGQVHAYAHSADVTGLWDRIGALPDVRGALVEASAAGVEVLDWPADGDPQLLQTFIDWGWDWLAPWLPPNGTPPSSDIDAHFTGSAGLPWPFEIGGTLDALDLPRDEACFLSLDLSDPIFQQRRLVTRCNADFASRRIAAVTAQVSYGNRSHSAVFTDNETADRFVCPVDPALGRTVTIRPVVSFTASSAVLELPEMRTDTENVLISVDTDGWLTIDLSAAALDWSTVRHVEVGLRYQDDEHGIELVEDFLKFDAAHPAQHYERALYAPVTKPYEMHLSYDLTDGRTVDVDWAPGTDRTVLIPPPSDIWRTVRLSAAGRFDGVTAYLVDLESDDGSGHTSSTTVRLTPEADTANWRTGADDMSSATLKYRLTTVFADGHSTVDAWRDAPRTQRLDIGTAPSAVLDVSIVADLIDFSVVKLVKTTLSHPGPAGQTDTHAVMFAPGQPTSVDLRLPMPDKDAQPQHGYTVTSTFYLRDGGHRSTPVTPGSDPVIVLQLPPV
ncbi:hypothetical protein ACF05L_33415 [Streptomyces bobili]|uniref:hypothetical protein n=1 Tax=Streptomyces bobili TaxID=67280 RepID=UPI003702BCD6